VGGGGGGGGGGTMCQPWYESEHEDELGEDCGSLQQSSRWFPGRKIFDNS